jgi:hypothetical protein
MHIHDIRNVKAAFPNRPESHHRKLCRGKEDEIERFIFRVPTFARPAAREQPVSCPPKKRQAPQRQIPNSSVSANRYRQRGNAKYFHIVWNTGFQGRIQRCAFNVLRAHC